MKPALRDRITKRGHKFDEHVCSRRTKSTRNWSFLIPGCHRRSRISCFPSLRTSVSPCRSAHPSSVRADARGGRIFSPCRVAPSLKSMQIFHEVLFAARAFAFATHWEKKYPSSQPLFPRCPLAAPFFHSVDTARRGGTWNEFITGDTTAEPLSRIRRF